MRGILILFAVAALSLLPSFNLSAAERNKPVRIGVLTETTAVYSDTFLRDIEGIIGKK